MKPITGVLMWTVLAAAWLAASALVADGTPVPPGLESPPPKSPEASLRSLRVRDGFAVELVVAEPLVRDPIAFDWGPDGSLWVVEMADYPQAVGGQDAPGGRVQLLRDSDGDGLYDRATVFLEGVAFPSSVMAWRRGVLVAAAPNVFYAEDTTGDGRADRREVLFSGFEPGNPQHRVNGFAWGLDNWVHLANGDSGGIVRSHKTGRRVGIGGRDLRIRPDDGSVDPETGWTQYGRSRDDWGNWFGTANERPIMHFALADHRLRRNPHLAPPSGRIVVASSDNTVLYPISRVLSHWEGYRPPAPGQHYRFTAACSTIVYRDDLFGVDYRDNTFTSEPVYNLVHRRVLKPHGVTFTSARAQGEEASEFLASTDSWFRPTTLRIGPDGALWVADMYRLVIEHPDWIDDRMEKTLDLRAGHDRGRIYRVYPTARPPRPIPNLEELDTAGLVAALDSPSGWQRDLAQRMLIWRADPSAAQPLQKMAGNCRRAQARLQALCTLDGLGMLSTKLLSSAMSDSHPGVRRHAVRLASARMLPTAATRRGEGGTAARGDGRNATPPQFPARAKTSPAMAAALLARTGDEDPLVRLECAYALGEWDDQRSARALATMAIRHADDPYLLAAVISSIDQRNLDQVLAAVFSGPDRQLPPGHLLRRLLGLATAMGDQTVLVRALGRVSAPNNGQYSPWQLSALGGILDALERRKMSLAELPAADRARLQPSLERITRMFAVARRIAVDENEALEQRELAVELLGRGPDRRGELDVLSGLLVPRSPVQIQLAAVESLGRQDDPRIADLLVAGWRGYGQQLRHAIVRVLCRRQTWQAALLESIERGVVRASDIDAAHRHRLLNHNSRLIREQAQTVLAQSTATSRAAVQRTHRSVVDMVGDVERGGELFRQKCAVCHRVAGVGHRVGPDLSALTDRSPGNLLGAILEPNRTVAQQFRTYIAVSHQGRQFAGILADETGNSITLLDQDGEQQVILRSEIDELASTGQSLMPEGLEEDLNQQALADVIAYVGTLGAEPKVFAGNQPRRITPSADGCLTLPAQSAAIYGPALAFDPGRTSLGPWSHSADRAVWALADAQGGRYAVWVEYAAAPTPGPGRWSLQAGDAKLIVSLERSPVGRDRVRQILAGYLDLVPSARHLTVRAVGTQPVGSVELRRLTLIPMSEKFGIGTRRAFSGNQPQVITAGHAGELRLPVAACEIFGETLALEPKYGNLGFWLSDSDRAVWTLRVTDGGTYLAFLDYACANGSAGNAYALGTCDARLVGRVRGTGTWDDYRQVLIGPIRLTPGMWRMTLQSTGPPRNCLMDLREIRLVPAPAGAPSS